MPHPEFNDILRSAFLNPNPIRIYSHTRLHTVFLKISELVHLWEAQFHRVETQSVERVEQSTCGQSGCTRTDSTLLWAVPKYTAKMTVNDIDSLLTPVANPSPTWVEPAIHTGIPASDTLRKLHEAVKKKSNVHLVFVYRHSDTPSLDSDHDKSISSLPLT
jgi:hypothetical protein